MSGGMAFANDAFPCEIPRKEIYGMKHLCRQRSAKTRVGSVLMEFVIVAPLYFILLGMLFILGDLAVNKFRMHVGDHFVTWMGGSRFAPAGKNAAGQLVVDGGKVGAYMKPMFANAIGGAIADFKVGFDPDDDSHHLNSFMALYFGAVTNLPVKLPAWVRGMANMSYYMTGEEPDGDVLKSVVTYDCAFYRSFCFHRLPISGIDDVDDSNAVANFPLDPFSRSRIHMSANDLVVRGFVRNVVSEPWVNMDDDKTANVGDGTLSSSHTLKRGRYLGLFAE